MHEQDAVAGHEENLRKSRRIDLGADFAAIDATLKDSFCDLEHSAVLSLKGLAKLWIAQPNGIQIEKGGQQTRAVLGDLVEGGDDCLNGLCDRRASFVILRFQSMAAS